MCTSLNLTIIVHIVKSHSLKNKISAHFHILKYYIFISFHWFVYTCTCMYPHLKVVVAWCTGPDLFIAKSNCDCENRCHVWMNAHTYIFLFEAIKLFSWGSCGQNKWQCIVIVPDYSNHLLPTKILRRLFRYAYHAYLKWPWLDLW